MPPLVYDELRKLASARMVEEKPGQILDTMALVHEAYLRRLGLTGDRAFAGRAHFFATAAAARRRILVDRARARQEFKAALWVVVAFHHPGSPEEVEQECANLVACLE